MRERASLGASPVWAFSYRFPTTSSECRPGDCALSLCRRERMCLIMTAKEQRKAAEDFAAKWLGSGLFDGESIRIPRFTEETRALLLDCLSVGFRPHRGLAAMPSANTEFTEHGAEMRCHRGRRGEERFVRLCVRRRHCVLRRQLNALSRIRSGRLRCFDIITSRKETKWQFANL